MKKWAIGWFTKNIFTPAGTDGAAAKLFGFELVFPKIPLPTKQDILDLLPEWMTDPLGAVSRLVGQLTKYLPHWLGGDPSQEDLRREAEIIAGQEGVKAVKATKGFADFSRDERQRAKQFAKAQAEFTHLRQKGALRSMGGAKTFEEYLIKGTGRYADRLRTGATAKKLGLGLDRGGDSAKFIKENKMFIDFLKHATTPSAKRSIFTHDSGLHKRLDRIFPSTESGQRAAAMMQANIQKSVDNVRQAGAQGSVNIQTNAPVTSTVTNTQGRVARAPIDTSSGL